MIAAQYFSFLLRIWQGDDLGGAGWLASLEDPSTKQVTYFKSMEELFEFLRKRSVSDNAQNNTQINDFMRNNHPKVI